jgi:hypothetical protein
MAGSAMRSFVENEMRMRSIRAELKSKGLAMCPANLAEEIKRKTIEFVFERRRVTEPLRRHLRAQ